MNKVIKTSHKLNAQSDKVWDRIRQGSGVDRWLPVIIDCEMQGDGEGAKRICSLEQGKMLETILKIDEENKIFQYAIDEQPLFPIDNVVGTMQVKQVVEGTELSWELSFRLKDENLFPTVKEAIEELYTAGANGLEQISN